MRPPKGLRIQLKVDEGVRIGEEISVWMGRRRSLIISAPKGVEISRIEDSEDDPQPEDQSGEEG